MIRSMVVVLLALSACSGSSKPRPAPGGGTGAAPDAAVANGTTPDANATQCEGPAPGPDYVCMENCGPPVVRQGDPPPGWSWLSPADVESRNKYGCPICLPPDARIATPDGEVAIAELTPGAAVLTLDEAGRPIEARALVVASTPAPRGHRIVRLILDDGRVVRGSGGHPIDDGRPLGTLQPGDAVGGARVVAIETVDLVGGRTWDLLVSGPTGIYLADGVALRSTLEAR